MWLIECQLVAFLTALWLWLSHRGPVMIDRLTEWLTDWLIDWLIDWLQVFQRSRADCNESYRVCCLFFLLLRHWRCFSFRVFTESSWLLISDFKSADVLLISEMCHSVCSKASVWRSNCLISNDLLTSIHHFLYNMMENVRHMFYGSRERPKMIL